MSIPELEIALQKALERQTKAIKALAPKHKGGEQEEFSAACEAVLEAERALAAAKGEPYAVEIDFPVSWDTGAPLPHLLQNDNRTFLTFFLHDVDPNWDGTWVKKREPNDSSAQKLAVVEFEHCLETKMGSPNDERFDAHPLYGKGFTAHCALGVENSSWVKEIEAMIAFPSERNLKHYILPFHDSTFECVAQSFKVEIHETSLFALLAEICRRLVASRLVE